MTPLADLIAHWEARAKECLKEIDEIVGRYNKDYHAAKARNSQVTDKDIKRMTDVWMREHRIARDTASWLTVMKNRGITT